MDHMLHRNQWSKITSMPVPWYEGQRFQIYLQYLNSWKTLENKTPCPSSLYSSNNYYLNNAASIDIHTHYRKSSCGMEDANPHKRQFAGTLGFCFTNACLVMKFFAKIWLTPPWIQDISSFGFNNVQNCKFVSNEKSLMHLSHLMNLCSTLWLKSTIQRLAITVSIDMTHHGKRIIQQHSSVEDVMFQFANHQKIIVVTFMLLMVYWKSITLTKLK